MKNKPKAGKTILAVTGILCMLTVCAFAVPKASADDISDESAAAEREYLEKRILPCGNHTFDYEEPELYDGRYVSENDPDFYFEVSGNEINLHGTPEKITENTEKQWHELSDTPDEETFSANVAEAAELWKDTVNIENVVTFHFPEDNPDTAKVADRTLIKFAYKPGYSHEPLMVFYDTDGSDKIITFGGERFILTDDSPKAPDLKAGRYFLNGDTDSCYTRNRKLL